MDLSDRIKWIDTTGVHYTLLLDGRRDVHIGFNKDIAKYVVWNNLRAWAGPGLNCACARFDDLDTARLFAVQLVIEYLEEL